MVSPRSILAASLIAFCCGALPADTAFAANAKTEYQKVQKDLRQQKKKLEEAKRAEKSVVSDLRRVTSELTQLDEQVVHKRQQIVELRGSLAKLEKDIAGRNTSLEEQKKHLRSRLLTLQRITNQKEAILILLSGDDSAKTLRVARYLGDIADRYSESIGEYHDQLKKLGSRKKELESMVRKLKDEEQNLTKLETAAREKKSEKEQLLVQVRKEKGTYERMVGELKESSDRLSRIIKEAEKREKSARKRPPQKAKGKERAPAADDEDEGDTAFSKLKGRLSWPARGSVAIRYGSQVDPMFNLPVFRSGIHIKTAEGTPVVAVSEGRVVYADEFKGYGQLVIVSHGGGYHTLYGNLGRIFPQKDSIIKQDQTIGEVGESATLGSGGLYFEIRYKGKPLDPQRWLKKAGG